MANKVPAIVMDVDLSCPRCYKKIKKILKKYRERYQIQDEIFDEKQNTVTINGACCPQKLMRKLCNEGGESIKSIKIVEEKPPETPKTQPKPKPADPNPPPPTVVAAPPPAPPKSDSSKTESADSAPAPKESEPKPIKPPSGPSPLKTHEFTPAAPEPGYPVVHPIGLNFRPYEEYGWPSMHYGRPQQYYDVYAMPSHTSPWKYFSEEDPATCTIM